MTTTRKVNEHTNIGDLQEGDVVLGERTSGTTVLFTVPALSGGAGVTDGDKGDITVSSSGAVWTIDTPTSTTVATDDKVLIKDTSNSDATRYVTAQSIADLAAGGVTSVNGETGVVTLTSDDISDAAQNNKFVTAADITKLGNLSGTNTGDQIISLTGDVTGSGTGSFAATIANDTVTYAKMQNVSATDKLLGRSTAGSGDVEEITCTAAGRAILDDATASDQRTTLGLGTLATQSGTFSGTSSGTNTGDQNLFQTISVSGQSDVVADSTTDTLTLAAGSNITITTNASTDTITIAATGGVSDGDKGDVSVASSGTVWTVDLPASATVATDDKVYIFDTSATDAKKYVTAQSIADLFKTTQAFHAYSSAAQTFSTGTATKVVLDAEVFDSGGRFDSTTNYRYTPTVAGTYLFTAEVTFQSSVDQMYCICQLNKNGTTFAEVNHKVSGTGTLACTVLGICKLNGTTDYVEFFGYQASGVNKNSLQGSPYTFMSGGLLEKD